MKYVVTQSPPQSRLLRWVRFNREIRVHVRESDPRPIYRRTRTRELKKGDFIHWMSAIDIGRDSITARACYEYAFEGRFLPSIKDSVARMYEYDNEQRLAIYEVYAKSYFSLKFKLIWSAQ